MVGGGGSGVGGTGILDSVRWRSKTSKTLSISLRSFVATVTFAPVSLAVKPEVEALLGRFMIGFELKGCARKALSVFGEELFVGIKTPLFVTPRKTPRTSLKGEARE
jgi:hypothetical protein